MCVFSKVKGQPIRWGQQWWPVDLDKKQLSGQVGDLPLPSFGNRQPAGTLWPGGEISLVGLIKLHILPTDQQSQRIMPLERVAFPTQSRWGGMQKAADFKAALVVSLVSVASSEKHIYLGFAAAVNVKQ